MKKLALTLPGNYQISPPEKFKAETFNTLGDVINELIPYIFALAGIILLFLIIWGGFELLTSGGDPKKVESARGKLTHAIVGFIIIFIAYWLVQILEAIFGIQIF